MTLSLARPRALNLTRLWTDAPAFIATALMATFGLIPLYAAMAIDSRLFQGEPVWVKPIKFHIALTIYLITLAFFARFMPADTRNSRPWRWFSYAFAFAVLAEMVWIGGAASVNTASHFNMEIPVMTAIYGVMGVFAVLLTSASLVMGLSIWRNPASGIAPALHLSLALGLILTFVLTVGVAGYMSSNNGHFVGASTLGLGVMGWSRDVGDLRVAHFLATHAMHAIPLAGLFALRAVVWASATAYVGLVLATFVQALQGQPFLPWLG